MAADGLRVLGVANGRVYRRAILPERQHDFAFEFIGLVGLAESCKACCPRCYRECLSEAGIRVVMITGDYPRALPQHIARQIGLEVRRSDYRP